MFTGLIEAICTVKSVSRHAGAMRLTVDLGHLARESKIGDSIAINGVCLTVAELGSTLATFNISAETLTKSNLGGLTTGSKVNTELAMRASDRFGGHIVAGHIDDTAKILAIKKLGKFADMIFEAPQQLLDQMVPKGSVAVDGISLTVAKTDQNCFTATIIPHTMEKTTLGRAKIGDMVNIETDIIVKTIKKQLEKILPKEKKLTVEKLKQLGF